MMNAAASTTTTKRLPKGEGVLKRVHEMERQVQKAAERAKRFSQMAQSAEQRVKVKKDRLATLVEQAQVAPVRSVKEVAAPISATVTKNVQREINNAVKKVASKFHIDVKAAPMKVTKGGVMTIRVVGQAAAKKIVRKPASKRRATKATA